MLPPLLKLLLQHPERIAERVSAYAVIASDQLDAFQQHAFRRLKLWLAMTLLGLTTLVFGSASLLILSTMGWSGVQHPWVLAGVPMALLVVMALVGVTLAGPSPGLTMAPLRQQLLDDVQTFSQVSRPPATSDRSPQSASDSGGPVHRESTDASASGRHPVKDLIKDLLRDQGSARAFWQAACRSYPALRTFSDAAEQVLDHVWKRHPLHDTVLRLERGIEDIAVPLIKRHPLRCAGAAALLSAALVTAKPWKAPGVRRALGQHLPRLWPQSHGLVEAVLPVILTTLAGLAVSASPAGKTSPRH